MKRMTVKLKSFRDYFQRSKATSNKRKYEENEVASLRDNNSDSYVHVGGHDTSNICHPLTSQIPTSNATETTSWPIPMTSNSSQNEDSKLYDSNPGSLLEERQESSYHPELKSDSPKTLLAQAPVATQKLTLAIIPPIEVQTPSDASHMTQQNGTTDKASHSASEHVSSHPNVEDQNNIPQRSSRKKERKKKPSLDGALWRTLGTRATYAEKRSELRESRSAIVVADISFMKFVRQIRNQHSDVYAHEILGQLETCFQALQNARNEHGPLEESLGLIEDKLDEEEYRITEMIKTKKSSVSDDFSHHGLPSDLDDTESVSTSVESEQLPVLNEYLSKIGDVKLLHEELGKSRYDYDRLRDIKERNDAFGLKMLPENLSWLAEFPTMEAELQANIRVVEEDIKRLRRLCLEEGIDVNAMNVGWGSVSSDSKTESDGESNSGSTDILHGPVSRSDDYNSYRCILYGPHGEGDKDFKELLTNFSDTFDRVRGWILHQVRSSFLEVRRLRRMQKEKLDLPTNDIEEWQRDVVKCWNYDPDPQSSKDQVRATATEWSYATQIPFDGKQPSIDKNEASLRKNPAMCLLVRHQLAFGQVLITQFTDRQRRIARSV